MRKRQVIRVLCVLCGLSSPAFAGRTLILPPYLRRVVMGFEKQKAEGDPIGALIFVALRLTNLSDISQTGTLRLLTGTQAYGIQVGRTTQYNKHFFLCASGTTSSDNILPGPVTWSLGAGAAGRYLVGVFFQSLYSDTNPTRHSVLTGTFNPILQIQVNEDRGAISGTMVPDLDKAYSGISTCDNVNLTPYSVTTPVLPDERSGVPLLLNGGRPF